MSTDASSTLGDLQVDKCAGKPVVLFWHVDILMGKREKKRSLDPANKKRA